METLFIEKNFCYTGEQLKPLFAYYHYGVLGDSVVSWLGPCKVDNSHMVDFEDLRLNEKIQGSMMAHFVFEIFNHELTSGILLQRLFASICRDYFSTKGVDLVRNGDDLYLDDKKFSISIASRSAVSVQIHFAFNISNQDTPVKTCALEDFNLKEFSKEMVISLMKLAALEWNAVKEALCKVKPL